MTQKIKRSRDLTLTILLIVLFFFELNVIFISQNPNFAEVFNNKIPWLTYLTLIEAIAYCISIVGLWRLKRWGYYSFFFTSILSLLLVVALIPFNGLANNPVLGLVISCAIRLAPLLYIYQKRHLFT